MDRGAWWATVHGVAQSRTRLHDFTLMPGLFTPLPGWFYTVSQRREPALPSAGDFPGLLQALPGWN